MLTEYGRCLLRKSACRTAASPLRRVQRHTKASHTTTDLLRTDCAGEAWSGKELSEQRVYTAPPPPKRGWYVGAFARTPAHLQSKTGFPEVVVYEMCFPRFRVLRIHRSKKSGSRVSVASLCLRENLPFKLKSGHGPNRRFPQFLLRESRVSIRSAVYSQSVLSSELLISKCGSQIPESWPVSTSKCT